MAKQFDLQQLLPEHIKKIKPYSSARDEFSGTANIYLDANENSLGSVGNQIRNRYPDPHQHLLKEKLAPIKGVNPDNIFFGNGSDEVIDLLYRAFCIPQKNHVLLLPPTYGMYEVCANLNNIEIRYSLLTSDFKIDIKSTLEKIEEETKLIFICSPNNPSGNLLNDNAIEEILQNSSGIVVIDEAYADFCPQKSWVKRLNEFPNLIVMQTFSKAWGLANIRLGMAFASPEIIKVLDKIKPPYNVNGITQEVALEALNNLEQKELYVKEINNERQKLLKKLAEMPYIQKVFPTDANFILIKTEKPRELYQFLLSRTIVVRDRSTQAQCAGCVRITVGTEQENIELLRALDDFKKI